jgi:hypothetical protein
MSWRTASPGIQTQFITATRLTDQNSKEIQTVTGKPLQLFLCVAGEGFRVATQFIVRRGTTI